MNTQTLEQLPDWFWPVLLVLVIWSLYWKMAALWHAARNKQLKWFVLFAILNTVGILEIIYLFGIEKARTEKLFK